MSISSEERKRVILDRLRGEGQVRVAQLSERLSVSEETVRRDLILLEKAGRVKRVYGGAIPAGGGMYEPPYLQRQNTKTGEKQRIGRRAAELIESGDTIAIDVGTTALELAKAIAGRERLTILTHSIAAAYHLMESVNSGRLDGSIIVIGGDLNPRQQSLTGPLSESALSKFRVDKAFISVGGITDRRGLSDYDVRETEMSALMIESADQSIVLADDSKIGREAFAQIAPLHRIHTVVSNIAMPVEWDNQPSLGHLHWMVAK
ncbi:DeoR/GlpR family DNA-binding transcription regulator [Paenibacillus sp. CN-4]|uniref:DeoR/GlpR family DNA-binding transcription regulator n=1 Tax=Paenibacillus nanchangensis TaxID=3348343 RepID=UPI0039791702